MKFTISKESFLDAINQVQHVVSSRTTLAILSNVLLKAKDGRLELTTTDLDVGVTCSVPAEVDEPGATTLPARRLATIVRELPSEAIEVKVDEKNVASIRSGPSYFKVLGLTSEEFPALPRFDDARDVYKRQVPQGRRQRTDPRQIRTRPGADAGWRAESGSREGSHQADQGS